MPKHRSEKPKVTKSKKTTKKQERLTAHETQQRKQILLVAGVIGGVILTILIIGIIDGFFITPNRVVASVGDHEITVKEYQAKARYTRWQLIQQSTELQNYISTYSQFGMDTGQFESNLQYYNSLLGSDSLLSDAVIEAMIEEIIIREKASELGIDVTEEMLQSSIKNEFGYYPDGTPTAESFATIAPLPTLNAEQLLLITPTATSAPTEIPTPTMESVEEDTQEEESVLPTATALPTATPYTAELYEEDYREFLNRIDTVADVGESYFFDSQEYNLLREKVFEAITADVGSTEEQVWARHILVEDATAVDSILGQLESGQMDFSELALMFSLDEGSAVNGGDLGWFGRGMMVPEFEEAAYALEVGEISEGVESQFGYHIIQVIAHEEVPISSDRQDQLKQQVFSEWLEAQKAELAESTVIDEELLVRYTPDHPRVDDPKVFEQLYGITIKEYNATDRVQIQLATEQAETLTAMPTSTEISETATPVPED